MRHVALNFNCGYARACIYQNSNPNRMGQNARETIDIAKRTKNFKEQFSSTYCLPDRYFTVSSGKDNTTQFDRDCNKILDGFKSKFLAGGDRESYLNTFSHKWYELSVEEHSLANCATCFELHKDSQQSFPLKPTYHHKAIVTVDTDALQRLGVKKFTTGVLTELNRVYEVEASTSFTDALVRTKSSGIAKKKSQNEKRKEKVKVQKELTKTVNDHFAEKAAISMLTECESKRKYHRKRMAQSFHSPQEQPLAKKKKSHSPDFSKVSWDTEEVKATAGTTINWSKVAKEHAIPGKNAGQVVKEFATKQGIDTSHNSHPQKESPL